MVGLWHCFPNIISYYINRIQQISHPIIIYNHPIISHIPCHIPCHNIYSGLPQILLGIIFFCSHDLKKSRPGTYVDVHKPAVQLTLSWGFGIILGERQGHAKTAKVPKAWYRVVFQYDRNDQRWSHFFWNMIYTCVHMYIYIYIHIHIHTYIYISIPRTFPMICRLERGCFLGVFSAWKKHAGDPEGTGARYSPFFWWTWIFSSW